MANLPGAEQRTVIDVIEGLLLKHEAQLAQHNPGG